MHVDVCLCVRMKDVNARARAYGACKCINCVRVCLFACFICLFV